MQTGTIDVQNRTFDIANVNETETSILLNNTQISFTYRNEAGELVRLVKPVNESIGQYEYKRALATKPRNAAMMDRVRGYHSGYLVADQKLSKGPRLMMNLDWDSHSFQTRDIQDSQGQSTTAAYVPVMLG